MTETPAPPAPPTPAPQPEPPSPPPPPAGNRPRTRRDDLIELMAILRPHWPIMRLDARSTGLVAEGEGGGQGGGSGGSGEGGSGGSGEGGGTGQGGQGGGSGGSGGQGGGSGDETVTLSKADHDRLQEAVATSNRELRELRRKQEEAEEEAKKKGGKHEELYTAEKAKNEGLIKRLGDNARDATVAEVAKRLRFRNPALAGRTISLDGIEATVDADTLDVKVSDADKTIIEKRLTELAEAEPYLVEGPPNRQMPGAGQGGNSGGSGNAGNDAMNDMLRRAAGRTV